MSCRHCENFISNKNKEAHTREPKHKREPETSGKKDIILTIFYFKTICGIQYFGFLLRQNVLRQKH